MKHPIKNQEYKEENQPYKEDIEEESLHGKYNLSGDQVYEGDMDERE
jgi:hypothetical protein